MGIHAIPHHVTYFMPCTICRAVPFSGLTRPVSGQQLDFHLPSGHIHPHPPPPPPGSCYSFLHCEGLVKRGALEAQ